MAGQRARDLWFNLTFPFVAVWMLLKILWFATGLLGLRPRKPRVADVVFPAILRLVDSPERCVLTCAAELRRNPLNVSSTAKLLLIDSALKLYTISNLHQPNNDLRTLWRLAVPSNRPIAYRFDLRRRRGGLKAAKAALADLVSADLLDSAETMDDLMNAVRRSAILDAP